MRRFYVPLTPSGGQLLSIPSIAMILAGFAPSLTQGVAGSAFVAYTDTPSGPVSGGENNKGCYLSVYLTNPGVFSDWGVTSHLYVGGVEVDNYRCLKPAVGSGTPGAGNGVYETWGLWRLTAQVGALGSPTLGTALAVTVSVGGVAAANATDGSGRYLDLDGNTITFTPNPGRIVFVDPVSGVDQTVGTVPDGTTHGSISTPLKNLQTYTTGASAFGGALTCPNSATTTPTASTTTPPGMHIILRGTATYTNYLTNTAFGQFRWACPWQVTGNAPTGAANTGHIVITSYPGPAGGNSPEAVAFVGPSSSAATANTGGIHGTDGARSQLSNSFNAAGYGKNFVISNLSITSNPLAPAADAAPINLQNRADGWRVVNNECVWSWTLNPGGVNGAQAAGIANSGIGVCRFGNWVHDIYGDSAFENHGIYVGAGGGNNEQNSFTAYNVIKNVTHGSGIQFHDGVTSTFYTGISVHHNWSQAVNKYGFNGNTNFRSGKIWQNVFVDSGNQGIYFGTGDIIAVNGVEVTNNTVIGWAQFAGSTGYTALWNNGTIAGTILAQNNVFYQRAAVTNPTYGFVSGSGITLDTNCYYDASGHLTTKPAGDAGGFFSNPLFNALASLDLTPSSSSPLRNAGVTPPTQGAISRDFAFVTRPQGSNTKIAIGALERVGG